MCVAIPSRVTAINGLCGTIDVDGARREVSLMLLEDVAVGDYVIVHAGFAIQKIEEEAARESLELLREAMNKLDAGQ